MSSNFLAIAEFNVGERLKGFRKSKNLTQQEFAKQLGTSASFISDIEKGKKLPGTSLLTSLKRIFDVDVNWLLTGEGEATIPLSYPECPCLDDFELFPKYEQSMAAGHGAYVISQEVDRQFAFRKEWLSRHGLNKKNCGLFPARGDSMLPLIGDGDIMLVDMSKKEMQDIIDGKIYCFSEGDLLKVKRLVRKGSGLLAISDNKAEIPNPLEVDLTQFRLIGKVVWIGHMVK
jgi:phage repressor protein C with HTH and peptisase S24 domain